MESRLDYDFSQVRVHTDSPAAESSRAIDALAYTVGQNVVFGAGQYAPKTSEGKQLLAHELTHVVQQTKPSGQRVLSSGNQVEREAGANSQRIVAGEAVKVKNRSTNGAIQREKKPTPKGGVKLESGFEKTSEGITNKYSFDANVKYSLDRARYFIEDIKISLKGSAKSGEPIDITAPEISALQAQIALGLLNLEAPKLTLPANIGELSFGAKLGTTTSLSQSFGEEGA
ncbi:MAG: DUF4157 domain-containing protein, partial [Proteobacteria bacterium]|nr:DUF4157 domain-containing protein [Pseudomonadota bacterium]